MRLGIVAPIDFVSKPFGGTVAFVSEFLNSGVIPEGWELALIGVRESDDGSGRALIRPGPQGSSVYLAVTGIRARSPLPLRARFCRALFAFREEIRSLRLDVVYAQTPEAGYAASHILPATPLVLHRHGLDSMIRRSRHWYGRITPVYSAFDTFITKRAVDSSQRILVTSGQRTFQEWISGQRAEIASRAIRIPALVDSRMFSPAIAPRTSGDGVALVAVGRLEHVKGFDLLVRTVSALRQRGVAAVLNIIGSGSQEGNLMSLAERLGVGVAVRFCGYLSREDLARALRTSDIYVSGSHQEGFSLALLEALSSGLPSVVTNVGAVDEIIREGANGFVMDGRDPDMMAALCLRVLQDIERMRDAARASIRCYASDVVSKDIVQNLEAAFRDHGAASPEAAPSKRVASTHVPKR